MGAWGAGSFENDDAMDWIAELTPGSDDGAIRDALKRVASPGYLEAPDCAVAVAAAEIVAAARGRPPASLPDDVTAWVSSKPKIGTDIIDLARRAHQRIVSESELKDLWEESDSADEWRAAMADLRGRLE